MKLACVAVVLAVLTLCDLPGCTNPQLTAAVEEARALSAQYKTSLEAQKANLEEQKAAAAEEVKAADEGGNESEKVLARAYLAKLEEASNRVEALLARVTQANEALSVPTKPDGSIDEAATGTAVGSLIGGPYGAAIGTGIGILIAGFSDWQRRRTQAAAVSMVNGIDAAAASVPGFKQALASAKPLLRAEYTTLAQKIVNKNKLATLPKAVT